MSGNGNGHHWSKFCWQDWQGDVALRMCSLAARGLWIECLAVMHQATPIGHLVINGKPATPRQLAAIARCTEREAARLLAELGEAGVYSVTTWGIIYSRRMVRDAAASEAGREHIRKRWEAPRPNSPPIRSNGQHPNSPPIREPITQESEPESEVEPEEGALSSGKEDSSTAAREPNAAPDSFNDHLDAPTPDSALPSRHAGPSSGNGQAKAEAAVLDPADAPADPQQLAALLREMQRNLRAKSYPPRAAILERHEQIEAMTRRPSMAKHLPPEVLAAERRRLGIRPLAPP